MRTSCGACLVSDSPRPDAPQKHQHADDSSPPVERDDPFDDLHVGQGHEARKPVERGRAREVLKGQRARAVIELAQFPGIRREPNLPQDRDGLIAEDAGDVSRRHERLKLAARGAVRRHGQRVGVGLADRQHAVDDRRGRPDRRRSAPQQAGDRLFGTAGARGHPGEHGIDRHHRLDAIVPVHDGDRVGSGGQHRLRHVANARLRAAALERFRPTTSCRNIFWGSRVSFAH